MDKIQSILYSVYNECYLLIVLVIGKYYRCYFEKIISNKFLVKNNINLSNILNKL